MVTIISTDKAPAAVGPYSQAFLAGGMLFASGQPPVDPDSGYAPDGIETQAVQCCQNVGQILKAAGITFDNVVKTTC